jgi:hypothetical protein
MDSHCREKSLREVMSFLTPSVNFETNIIVTISLADFELCAEMKHDSV